MAKREEITDQDEEFAADEPAAFSGFLLRLSDGDAHEQLSIKLQNVAVACLEDARATNQQSKGELTFKVKLKVEANGVTGIGYEIKTKIPEPKCAGSVGWISEGGNVVWENPKQKKLPFRDVSGKREFRDVEVIEPKVRSV